MASSLPNPSIDWDSPHLPEAWKKFKQLVDLMFNGPLKSKTEDVKVNYFLIWIGEKGRDICNTFTDITDLNRNKLKTYYDNVEQYVQPKTNIVFSRYKFNNRIQEIAETFDSFVTDLKLLVQECNYQEPDEMVRDKIVFSINSPAIREKLIIEGSDLTLDGAVEIAHCHELSKSQMRTKSAFEHENPPTSQVHSVKFYKDCYFCGRDHNKGECPAYGSTCKKCKGKNHWAKQCEVVLKHQQSRKNHQRKRSRSLWRRRDIKNKPVHKLAEDDTELAIFTVGQEKTTQLKVKLNLKNSKKHLVAQVDTGAGTNVLPSRCFKQIYPQYILANGKPDTSSTVLYPQALSKLTAYDGKEITHYGTTEIICSVNGTDYTPLQFYVCESDGPIILGLEDSCRLELININKSATEVTVCVVNKSQGPIKNKTDLIAKYPKAFESLGKFPNKATLHLKEDHTPVVQSPRRCPINLKGEIQTSLDDMEKQGIISKVPQGVPTAWLSNLVYARKPNNKLRICLDPRDLNANLQCTYHRAPTVEEITHKLSGATVFSKLDAKNGYWSIVLDEPSSMLTTFNSPASNQRYKFNRLPFGINVSQDLFQESMDHITSGLHGVISIADDICIFGENENDHDVNMHKFMEKAEENGLVLNPEKCFVKVPQINFFGMTYSKDGVSPDESRIQEIKALPTPTTKPKLQSFLGMIQYLARFIPKLSDQTDALRNLLKKDAEFKWTASHTEAFQALKDSITESVTLNYFNPTLDTKIQVDASHKALGAALIQIDPKQPNTERIISFASKSLTETETRYANIEREFLAVVFGAEKFHSYIFGSEEIIVESDHKPLEAIHLKSIAQAPPQLQRMMLRLQPYNICIKYRKGSELQLADFLSCHCSQKCDKEIPLDHTIHSIKWSKQKLTKLKQETSADSTLSALCHMVTSGWPNQCSLLPTSLKPFWSVKDFISIDDGILLKGNRIIIPPKLQGDVLNQLHNHSHQGISKTRFLARKCVYWPNIDKDIENLVGHCTICNTYVNSLPPEPMHERNLPSSPWEMLGTDLFDYNGQKYLIVGDYYSKFPILRRLNGESTKVIVQHFKQIFSEHGIPCILYSDNGPCYSSEEFRQFSLGYGFQHVTSLSSE